MSSAKGAKGAKGCQGRRYSCGGIGGGQAPKGAVRPSPRAAPFHSALSEPALPIACQSKGAEGCRESASTLSDYHHQWIPIVGAEHCHIIPGVSASTGCQP